jgi:ParB family chromosome partitioning protein
MVDISTIPRRTKAAMLQRAARYVDDHPNAGNPGLILPTIASDNSMTLDTVKAIVQAHGWPRAESMRRAAAVLTTDAGAVLAPPDDSLTGKRLEDRLPKTTAAAVAHEDQTFELLDVEDLHPDPDNVRDDLGDLSELAASIRDVGILQPIVARLVDNKLIIVMGHRRHAAARLAGVYQVPVIIRTAEMDPDEVLAAMILENGQRLNLDPIEEARALARLKRADDSSDQLLAERISKSQPYVSGRLALLSLTPAQQAAVRAGTLSLTRAVKLGRDQGGTTTPGAHGKKSAAHLDWHHPLAEKAAILCEHNGHHKNKPGRPGGVACGECWEAVIRADERDRVGAQAVPA